MKFVQKKVIISTLFLCVLMGMPLNAKIKIETGEVKAPKADPKVNHSEDIIISKSGVDEYGPLNPVPIGVDIEEYNSVDNYKVDLKTLDLRIKYFSPTYKNIKYGALSSYLMAYYIRGGNNELQYNAKAYTKEILDLSNEYRAHADKLKKERDSLDVDSPNYKDRFTALSAEIATTTYMSRAVKTKYEESNRTINSTKIALGLNKSLYNANNVDSNGQVRYARELITKNIASAILTYFELKMYVSILEKQSNMYYDMYVLYQKNNALGTMTSNEVFSSLSNYENAKTLLRSTSTTMRNVKEQIASGLGYSLSDIDKIEFVEPDVDMDYLNSINFDSDKVTAYTSNSEYYNLSLSERDKKLPQSTGEELLNKRKTYVSEKVMAAFDSLYGKLQSAILKYQSSFYLGSVCDLNELANLRKFNSRLISELEYKGLEIKNSADRLQVISAKYDLIKATNDYYYGVRGHVDIE